MSEIVLFHHARGLTPGMVSFAERIRTEGHTVHTPDFYDGRTLDSTEEGVDFAQQLGFETLVERAAIFAAGLNNLDAVIGVSLGVMPAYRIAQTTRGIRLCAAISAALPIDPESRPWPPQTALQLHLGTRDPWAVDEDLPVARELVDPHTGIGAATLYEYAVDTHLFIDESTEDYRPEAADTVVERILDSLREL